MKKILQRCLYLIVLNCFVILFSGCGETLVIIHPDYNYFTVTKDTLKEKTRIIKTVDKRNADSSNYIGIVQTGITYPT